MQSFPNLPTKQCQCPADQMQVTTSTLVGRVEEGPALEKEKLASYKTTN